MIALLQQLDLYKNTYPREHSKLESMIQFLQKHPKKAFDRVLEEGHFTASGCIVNKQRTKVLLVHHKKLDIWLQPGGHADGEEDLVEVAKKKFEKRQVYRIFLLFLKRFLILIFI